jgi:type IV secretory pathway VirB10-like protein
MFPSESALDTILTAVIAITLAFYATFLIRLKPPKEDKVTSNNESEKKENASLKTKGLEKPTTPAETKKNAGEKPASPVETQKIREEPTKTVQTEPDIETDRSFEKKKAEEEKKSFFLFGNSKFKGCSHKFGYLGTLPKNTPIPDECFGCPKILECLMRSKNR